MISRTLFRHRMGLVAAALCGASPLLATSAGSSAAPFALDLFLGSLVLLTFLRLMVSPGWTDWIFHGIVLAAGAYANMFLLLLIPAEAMFLVLYHRSYRSRVLPWMGAVGIAFLLFWPWMPSAGRQLERMYGHDDLVTDSMGLRISCLFTELSLGRLHALYPLTPVISPLPPGLEDQALAMRRPDLTQEDAMVGGLQALQMFFLGCFSMLMLVGLVAAMRISVWPMPDHLRTRRDTLRMLKGALRSRKSLPSIQEDTVLQTRQSAVLLASCFFTPLGLAVLGAVLKEWKFEGSMLLFLVVPYLILVARGLGALEWRIMFFAALVLILGGSLFYGLASRGIEELTHGSERAAQYLKAETRPEDAVLHTDPSSYFPILFYAGPLRDRFERFSFIAGETVAQVWGGSYLGGRVCVPDFHSLSSHPRVWWISTLAPPRSDYARLRRFLSLSSSDPTSKEPLTPPPNWKREDEQRFSNVLVTLYTRQNEGS
jgi:hypothetical protein